LLLKPGKHIKCQLTLFGGDRETVNKSYGYSGKGVATYPNGDIYEGHFVNGVRII
jgi:hypothetical protein